MNKNLKCFLVIAMMFLVCFSCNKNSDLADKKEVIKVETNDSTDDLDRYKLKMSLEEKKEDYEFFWDFVYNGWPFLEVCQRRGVDLGKIKKEYSKKLEELTFKADYKNFYDDLCYEIVGKEFISHFWPLPYNEYVFLKEKYEYPIINTDGSENKKIIKFYDSTPDDPYKNTSSLRDRSRKYTFKDTEKLLPSTSIIKQGEIAYIKIPNFRLNEREKKQYYNILYSFLSNIKDYKHLIIDVSENAGGYYEVWVSLVLLVSAPNKEITFKQYGLYNENEYTKIYMDKLLSDFKIDEVSLETIDNLKNARTKKHNKAFVEKIIIPALTLSGDTKPLKDRKIWVLIDENSYSAADQFASFCKVTSWATIVGNNSGGGGGLSTKFIRYFDLPKSGLIIRSDIAYALNKEGYCNAEVGTIPDIYTTEGKTALETCLDAIKEYDKKNGE